MCAFEPKHIGPASGLAKAALALALLAPLAGCGTSDRMRTSSIPLDDYRVRHPVLLSRDKTAIDIFPSAADRGFDRRTAKEVAGFARDYQEAGEGPVLVLVPVGPGVGSRQPAVAGIRRVFAALGLHPAFVVSTYPIGNPGLASPVRLSFNGLKAKVGDQCGQWPADLGPGATIEEWGNKPFYNLGCANQSMLAAQVADPRDLVTPRGEEPADTLVRSRAIESIRKGTDPATAWTTRNTSISSVGGS